MLTNLKRKEAKKKPVFFYDIGGDQRIKKRASIPHRHTCTGKAKLARHRSGLLHKAKLWL